MSAPSKTAFFNFLKGLAKASGLSEKRCSICLNPHIPEESPFHPTLLACPECQKELIRHDFPVCRKCGLPAGPSEAAPGLCPECQKSPPPWDEAAYFGPYSGKLKDLTLALKYSGALYLSELCADLLLESAQCLPAPDLIIPVPLARSRLKKRGFNQALEIGRHLSKRTGAPLSFNALKRIRDNRPQEGLGRADRIENMRGAFKAGKEACGASVWLIDDVMTTGSTLAECARALKSAGAKGVRLLFLARTMSGGA